MTNDQKRLKGIRERMKRAEVENPWRACKLGIFGYNVIEPYGAFGRNDVLIASGLDGYTAAFLAAVPEDMRWLIRELEYAWEKKPTLKRGRVTHKRGKRT